MIQDNIHIKPKFSDEAKRKESQNDGLEKGYIGFGNLPNQLYSKIATKPVEFNMLVIGDANSGCSTLINNLFNAQIFDANDKESTTTFPQKINIGTTEALLTERDFKLHLSVIRAHGFGELLNNSKSWNPIVQCIRDRFKAYFRAENAMERNSVISDCRIHCCLYLLPNRLRELDILTLKAIHRQVPIIPVISRADSFTPSELLSLKKYVLEEFKKHQIVYFDFSRLNVHTTPEAERLTAEMTSRLPFAVVASENFHPLVNSNVRGRKYQWGLVQVDSLQHSDLHALRYLLLSVGLPNLINYTHTESYKEYRRGKLLGSRDPDVSPDQEINPISQLEKERANMVNRLNDAEKNMDELFNSKVTQKETKLRENQESYDVKASKYKHENVLRREKIEQARASFEQEQASFLKASPSFISYRKAKKEKKKSVANLKIHNHQ